MPKVESRDKGITHVYEEYCPEGLTDNTRIFEIKGDRKPQPSVCVCGSGLEVDVPKAYEAMGDVAMAFGDGAIAAIDYAMAHLAPKPAQTHKSAIREVLAPNVYKPVSS